MHSPHVIPCHLVFDLYTSCSTCMSVYNHDVVGGYREPRYTSPSISSGVNRAPSTDQRWFYRYPAGMEDRLGTHGIDVRSSRDVRTTSQYAPSNAMSSTSYARPSTSVGMRSAELKLERPGWGSYMPSKYEVSPLCIV